VVVSDDASDNTAAKEVENYVYNLKDPTVSYYYHKDNLMEFEHNRFLFRQCSEEFLAILHDDDLWESRFLERCIHILSHDESLAYITTGQYVIDENGNRQLEMTKQYWKWTGRSCYAEGPLAILEPLLSHGFFTLSSTVFRTAALKLKCCLKSLPSS
jgi:hypothetical protein